MPDDNFNRCCEDLPVRYNCRKTKALARHFESLCRFLKEEASQVMWTMFGGFLRQGTYATGLSDVDVTPILNQSDLPPES